MEINKIIHGDCGDVLKRYPDNFFNLIITSPPYANQRKKVYSGVDGKDYVDWFISLSNEFYRVLSDDGTFILNIKEHTENGEKHTYVIELILSLKKQGWLWTEEFIWHKKNSVPGKWPNRLSNAWERLLQFNKNKKFIMCQESVMIPAKQDSNKSCIRKMKKYKNDGRVYRKTGSGFGFLYSKMKVRDMKYPNNVLFLPSVSTNKKHPAVFPSKIPNWFIKLFSKEGDIVLDPFCGSGTTVIEARKLNRNYLGIDCEKKYCDLAESQLKKSHQLNLVNFF
jgi:DNA modification methylase